MSTTQWDALMRNDVCEKFFADHSYTRDHSLRVYKAAKSRKLSASSCAAALLHDVVEDTGYSLGYLQTLYAKCPYIRPALKLVEVLTRKPDETYMDYIKRVVRNPKARLIKILDIEDNLFSTLTDDGYCSHSLAERYIRALTYLVQERYDYEKEYLLNGNTGN